MKLVVGLGNVGKEYIDTRHNVGFMAIDRIAEANGVQIDTEKFGGRYAVIHKNNEKILLLKPEKFMNLSGEVIHKYVNYFDIKIEDLWILCDDLDLPIGSYRLRYRGSSGGHNGLKNIELHLKTQEYKRMKIGISNDKSMDTKDYVLGKFSQNEKDLLQSILDKIPEIFDAFLTISYDNVMNRYNKK